MPGDSAIMLTAGATARTNRSFYDALWSQTSPIRPERFNTWPLIAGLLPEAPMRLEIGPGMRPRLPVAGTHFIDLSAPVIKWLNTRGARAQPGDASVLPFEDDTFDLLCAFDVIEHVDDDLRVFSELNRVLKEDGLLIFSVPLHASSWNSFDEFVGHVRRYEPDHLTSILQSHNLVLEKSAVYGMQPASSRLLACGMWFLTNLRTSSLFWYNRVFMPLGLYYQKPLKFNTGLINTDGVDEIVLVCRCGRGAA